MTITPRLNAINAATGLSPCRLKVEAPQTLSSLSVIDGVTPVAGDRILVTGQTDVSDNGIYIASSSAWSRSSDFNEPDDTVVGRPVWVTDGTLAGLYVWEASGAGYVATPIAVTADGALSIAKTSGLQAALDAKADSTVTPHYIADLTALRASTTDKPTILDDGSIWTTTATTGHGVSDDGALNVVGGNGWLWTLYQPALADIAALKAAAGGGFAYVVETGNTFAWQAGDQTDLIDGTSLLDDGSWGVAPDSDTTGASGAWKSGKTVQWADYIAARHRSVLSKANNALSTTIPNGITLGNSIVQGSGSTSATKTIMNRMGVRLYDRYSVGTTNDWVPGGRGVGGSTTASVVCYVADDADAGVAPTQGFYTSPVDWAGIITLRNDVTLVAATRSRDLVYSALSKLESKGIDAFLITDPPAINVTTGAITDTQANFGDWYDPALTAAYEVGSSVVDVWRMYSDLSAEGFNLIPLYTDTVHPSDAGYDLMSLLWFKAFITPSSDRARVVSRLSQEGRSDAIANYTPSSGSVTTATIVTGLVTSATSRMVAKDETDVYVYELANGETQTYACPAPCHGIIVNMLGGVSGSVSLNYGSVTVAGTATAEVGFVRETAKYFGLVKSVTPYDKIHNLIITSSGDTRIIGVTFLTDFFLQRFGIWRGAVETGTWADATLSTGEDCRSTTAIGDTAALQIFGSKVRFYYERSTVGGKFRYRADGGSWTEIDSYLVASPLSSYIIIDLGVNGWHDLEFETLTANPSSGGSTVKIGDFGHFAGQSMPAEVAYLADTTAIETRLPISKAEISATISGSPSAFRSVDGQTFTLGGTGSAIVTLTRE